MAFSLNILMASVLLDLCIGLPSLFFGAGASRTAGTNHAARAYAPISARARTYAIQGDLSSSVSLQKERI